MPHCVGESETSGGDEWSSGDETDSSTTVSSTHQDPHCDCCYCHMLHHKQGGGRQKYSDRRERLLKILSRKKNARNNAVCPNTSSANAVTAASDSTEVPTSTGGTPLGGQNIDKIMDYIEGNQTDEAKRAKKAAKKARQRQKKLALKKEKKEEEKMKLEDKKGECEEEEEEEEEVEDGPLAELRRRAPDVTITVVRPGQQTSRTASSPQHSHLKNFHHSLNHPQELFSILPGILPKEGNHSLSLASILQRLPQASVIVNLLSVQWLVGVNKEALAIS
ncbi:hypothetical protein C7M84_009454 [Penaeus vannamei]|uniref:Uncharacterized protein n=1 Tax=Penaeus vannamei TaxID=6689 RepID=A0A3R7PHN7_PENVA|nr:hypothetical protein C7M84_009454 [Penaeus vannamei]